MYMSLKGEHLVPPYLNQHSLQTAGGNLTAASTAVPPAMKSANNNLPNKHLVISKLKHSILHV